MEFENGVSATIRGPVETMQSGMSLLWIGLFVAAVLVYLVLMAQFRSFIDPLIIMLAVPLGLGGVLFVLLSDRHEYQHPVADGHADDDRRRRQQLDSAGRIRQPSAGGRVVRPRRGIVVGDKFVCGRF